MSSNRLYPGFRNPLLGPPRTTYPSHLAVVGAGTIGPDIGYYLKSALPEATLTLVDISEDALSAARERIEGYAQKGVKRKKMSEKKAEKVLENIVTSTDYDKLSSAEIVIEAASENVDIKKRIFSMIEDRVQADTIITSNTSSIPASRMFGDMRNPSRTTVTHFFAPAWRNPAVEVIDWHESDREVVDYLRWFFAVTGKVPFVTDDVVCFMLDRIFDNWCNESGYLLDGATSVQIDRVAEEFVHAGPFFVLNLSNGNPIIIETNTRQMEESEAYQPANIFNSVDRWVVERPGTEVEVPADTASTVRERLLGILFSQSLDIIVRDIGTPADLNLGCELALGFKQGPLDIMAGEGPAETRRVLDRFCEKRPGLPGIGALSQTGDPTDFRRYVLVDRIDDVIVITIRRPAQLNALTDKVTDEILSAIREFEEDDGVSGFVITGYGPRAFCAGADIGRFPEMLGDAEASAQYSRDTSRLLVHLDEMEKPVVAAVNGFALGGGAELAIRCHDMVSTSRAFFQFPEVTLGILPGIGGLVVPYRKWPQASDLWTEMIARAERLSAEKAKEIGVVSAIEDDYDGLVRAAARRVSELQGKLPFQYPSPEGLGAGDIKEPKAETPDGRTLSGEVVAIIVDGIRRGIDASDLPRALEEGYEAFGRVATTPAAKEGIGAFLEGRKPDFSDK